MTCLAALVAATLPALRLRAQAPRPNIVHLYADDLGWGSVGFNGQTQIATPNIDALASGGMSLLNAYAATVCSSSRASFYTGFHSGHANVDGNSELTQGFRADEIMTPQVLAPAGYTSAVFGKWGFGATGGTSNPVIDVPQSLPTNHGFDEFYGYLNHGAAQNYFYPFMWQSVPNPNPALPPNIVRVSNSQYSHDVFAAKSEQFVADHADDPDPFYLEVAYTIPHYDIDAIASAPGGYGQYAAMPWTNQQKAYAAMITRMDASIGALMDRLDDPNGDNNTSDSILDNTLVIFTSDNGPTVDDATPMDFFDANGVYRGGKFEVFEGGIHVPGAAYWRNTIAPGSTSAYRTDLADFLATAADLAGVEAPVGIDGTSIAPILTGEGRMRERDYLVFEHQGSDGADPETRIGRWAVIRQDGKKLIRYDNESSALYDLATDPDENSPLSLGANAALVAELEAYAIAEGVTRGVVQYRTWSGPGGGELHTAQHWQSPTSPDGYWSAVVRNSSASPAIAHVSTDVETLGVEVRGESAEQVVEVHSGRTLSGRNEVRVGANGRIDLNGGTLATNRWVNVRASGEVRGHGTVAGNVYNEGTMAPGRQSYSPAWPVAEPPALPPINLNTGTVTAVNFDFTGIQDDVPVSQTTTISQYLELTHGLDFGPSVGPRWGAGGTDEGDELNVIGHTASSLAAAKTAGDYVTFTVNPVAGAGMVPTSVSFRLWRNGGASARNFAILSSVDGFNAVLNQATYTDTGIAAQHTLTANIPAVADADAFSTPIEYRLYAWGATAATGGTHVNLASLNARFVAVPTLEFNFNGVQDNAPLTALRRQTANLTLTAGLNFGPGLAPRGPGHATNAGNEFNVTGFSIGSTMDSALVGDDYLSFAVQPVAGMAMFPDSVSFKIWRQASGSATDYALFSSVGGFSDGQQLSTAHLTTTGSGNQHTVIGSFAGAPPTTDAVEFRLYGWNAATSTDSTHVVGASMRARFASVVGTPIDPTGQLTVQGDLYHLDGGLISIDLGGISPGVDYDSIDVLGKLELEGDLAIALADVGETQYAPTLGDTFTILTATQGITGQFDVVTLPELANGLDWQVEYLSNSVQLSVYVPGDFNYDGNVDTADYVSWRKFDGTATDYNSWRENFGIAFDGGEAPNPLESHINVPEPASIVLLLSAAIFYRRSERRSLTGDEAIFSPSVRVWPAA
jgi:arylsulfatase A-like enzyme